MPNTPDLAALYQKHRDAMYRVAAQVLGEGGIADQKVDVVHDTFMSLMASPPSEEVRNWEAFLIKCVKYKATDRLRSAEFRQSRSPVLSGRSPSPKSRADPRGGTRTAPPDDGMGPFAFADFCRQRVRKTTVYRTPSAARVPDVRSCGQCRPA